MAESNTLCWKCEWAAGKDKKCPWATKFQPVPDWDAEPTKVYCPEKKDSYIDSFIVKKCPLFEIDHVIKNNSRMPRGTNYKFKGAKQETIETIEYLYFDMKIPIKTIAEFVEYSEDRVRRVCEKLNERRIT